jgi:hypothetical protein
MAKGRDNDLMDRLRARGLRKKHAKSVAKAIGPGPRKSPPKVVTRVISDLRVLVDEIEERATGRTAKRKAAARKAAQTRKRKAQTRSSAAKKAAKTRSSKGGSGSRKRS